MNTKPCSFALSVLIGLATALGQAQLASFSPDGAQLAVAHSDKVVVFDAASGKALKTLSGHRDPVQCVAFAKDGKTLASGSYDGTVRLWNPANGRMIREIKVPGDGITDSSVAAVCFSPDGKSLAAGSLEAIFLFRVESGQSLAKLEGHAQQVTSLSFSNNGKLLASGSADGTAQIWVVERGWSQLTFKPDRTWSVSFSPDGESLLTGSEAGAVIWSVADGSQSRVLVKDHSVRSAQYSANGKSVATLSEGIASVWSSTGTPMGKFGKASEDFGARLQFVALSPSGDLVATVAPALAEIWTVATGKKRATLQLPKA